MKQSSCCAQLRELTDEDLPADELQRLGRVDALLRAVVPADDQNEEPSRECERVRASISAALDSELSELESTRMQSHVEDCASCWAFGADAETFAATLRAAPLEAPRAQVVAVPPSGGTAGGSHERRTPVRSSLRLVSTSPKARSARARTDLLDLKLTFGELSLIYKSLQSAKTLGALPPQDELLEDTIQLVDQALRTAI